MSSVSIQAGQVLWLVFSMLGAFFIMYALLHQRYKVAAAVGLALFILFVANPVRWTVPGSAAFERATFTDKAEPVELYKHDRPSFEDHQRSKLDNLKLQSQEIEDEANNQ